MIFNDNVVRAQTTPSKELYYHFNKLNRLTNRNKKDFAIQYALAYFVMNRIYITDEDFRDIKEKITKFLKEAEKHNEETLKKLGE